MLKASILMLAMCCQFSDGDIVGIGYLPGDNGGGASGISGDGSTVIGSTTTGGILPIAYRWTEDAPIQSLGDLFGGINSSSASGVSYDGSVVVGSSSTNNGFASFRWTEESGLTNIGDGFARDVSADGNTVVGGNDLGGYIWTPNLGALAIGSISSGGGSTANAVSADGLVVAGFAGNDVGRPEAIRWSENTGMTGLGTLTGDNFDISRAMGISADGTTIVGISDSTSIDEEAFRWTLETGMVGLGDLAGGDDFSSANDVSADGSIIVGSSETDEGLRAFIWTETTGMLNLENLLADVGFDLSQWQSLNSATGISDDGRFIVGTGTNLMGRSEGFRVRFNAVPEPTSAAILICAATFCAVRRRKR